MNSRRTIDVKLALERHPPGSSDPLDGRLSKV
jgi:hypothetical protein